MIDNFTPVSTLFSPVALFTIFLLPMDQAKDQPANPKPQMRIMAADDTCRNRVNKPITLKRGDKVEVLRTVKPSGPATKGLAPNDPLSMKVNLSYVRAVSGSNSGEYCWVATVHVE